MKTKSEITLSLKEEEKVILSKTDINEAFLFVEKEYSENNYIVFTANQKGYYIISIDAGLKDSFVYYDGGTFEFKIPCGEKLLAYNPMAFQGTQHYIHARVASCSEIKCRKNLCRNTLDGHSNNALFPHAVATVETRNESVFAARNAIDGVVANSYHGNWPFASWGINSDPEAALTVEFKREVVVDEIALYLRADFPHDSYWRSATITFSDGSKEQFNFAKTHAKQSFKIQERVITSLTIDSLIIEETETSPFPALIQLEAYGCEK
jgi:hypothetical protein